MATDAAELNEATTRWERAATTKWGAYISDAEERAILHGHALSGEPGTALDIGCEGGRWARVLTDLGWRMICSDINREALAICQKRLPEATCILRQPEENTLPCASGSVGLFLCIEVSPIIEADWFFSEASRVLKRGGLIVVVYWNLLSFRGLFSHARALLAGGLDFYTTAYFARKKVAKKNGFRVVYEDGFCWFPFRRESNSLLIPFVISLEKQLGLRRLVAFSPWVVTVLQKE
jgi:SAM-dependent methyltransferase